MMNVQTLATILDTALAIEIVMMWIYSEYLHKMPDESKDYYSPGVDVHTKDAAYKIQDVGFSSN